MNRCNCLGLALTLLLPMARFRALAEAAASEMPRIQVAANRQAFAEENTARRFVPWGFNYDHDTSGRLLEDYWEQEWSRVETDFRAMKRLDANVVRIHLQLGKFMLGPHTPDAASLRRLARLLALAEKVGLYLDLTGLACYHKQEVPAWYDRLDEQQRWAVQACFWEAVARRCASSPAVFCYDLMNEPVVPGDVRKPGDWLGPPFAGSCFVQFITLDPRNRPRAEIARQWCRTLAAAVRKHDPRRLVTVGLVSWSLDRPGLSSGFVPEKIVGDLDFLAVHSYPEKGKVNEALDTLRRFAVGKPVIVEEMFPLPCSAAELGIFIDRSSATASGWMGFYWGKTLAEYRRANTIADGIVADWLELFQKKTAAVTGQAAGASGLEH